MNVCATVQEKEKKTQILQVFICKYCSIRRDKVTFMVNLARKIHILHYLFFLFKLYASFSFTSFSGDHLFLFLVCATLWLFRNQ
jgi:hypothetical protein